ncbi:class I SAM-dependent methyltransferase [Actinokineospora iranica]|uniref:Methyltransferase domain-containing protein n=1 Tax=Actinokineospora iranica TaxID=1271860 RepID=A0A1G6RZA5_9PSEU|nr:class I SAM-dependent methyltransferase [Actinokineospora iranica]SDD09286.1 Methyltransferase domain-containing protein [Actinokineospora iranica]
MLSATRPDVALHGVDLSPDMIAVAERDLAGSGVSLHVADVARLPFADDSVDVAVSSLALHHWPDPVAAMAELARVTRPDGVLALYDFRFTDMEPAMAALRAHPAVAADSVRRRPARRGPRLDARLHPSGAARSTDAAAR